jgi:hypothetical protein
MCLFNAPDWYRMGVEYAQGLLSTREVSSSNLGQSDSGFQRCSSVTRFDFIKLATTILHRLKYIVRNHALPP